ncbi:MAG: hypothetical protein Q8N99_02970 [Nanoarchaeota archaeon]|nr:hypothetical protein [Nanoarchaeota archaeon]
METLTQISGMPKDKLEKFLARLRGEASFEDIFQEIRKRCYRPEGYAIDPRTGSQVVFSKSREKRPDIYGGKSPCIICNGDEEEIPPFVMAKRLSSGAYAFVNENKYAFLNPDGLLFDITNSAGMFRGQIF